MMNRYLHILFWLLPLLTWGQKQDIRLSADTREIFPGEVFTIRAVSPHAGVIKIHFPTEFVKHDGLQNGLKQELNSNSGKLEEVFFIAQNGSFSKPGTYTFQASVEHNNKIITSHPFEVRVNKTVRDLSSATSLSNPVTALIEPAQKKVYQGQYVFVQAKILSRFDVAVHNYTTAKLPEKTEKIQLDQPEQRYVRKEKNGGKDLYVSCFDEQLLYFSKPGKYVIEPFTLHAAYEDNTNYHKNFIVSSSAEITVVPLPENPYGNVYNGVGSYRITEQLMAERPEQGKILTLTLEVKGKGSLQQFKLPEIKISPAFQLYGDPEVHKEINYTADGPEGTLKYIYYIQVLDAGVHHLAPFDVVFFDPEKGNYQRFTSKEQVLNVAENKEFTKQQIALKKNGEVLAGEFSAGENKKEISPSKNKTARIWVWTGISSPIFLGLLFLLFRMKKGNTESTPESVVREKEIEEIREERKNVALQTLENAHQKEKEQAYEEGLKELEKAIKYAAASLSLSQDILIGKEELAVNLSAAGVDEAVVESTKTALALCEEGRYLFDGQARCFEKALEYSELLFSYIA